MSATTPRDEPGRAPRRLSAREITEVVARATGVTWAEIVSRSRDRHIVLARHLAFYFIRASTNMSYPQIGMYFAMDHASIIYGRKKVERRLDAGDPYVTGVVNQIEGMIRELKGGEANQREPRP